MGNRGSIIVNFLTLLIIVVTGCSGAFFLALFLSPNSGFNPFPPPTKPALAVLPTPTDTPNFPTLPPEWTPTESGAAPADTPIPISTDTPTVADVPTETPTRAGGGAPEATETPTRVVTLDPSITPNTPTPSPTGPTPTPSRTPSTFQFTLQDTGIQHMKQFTHPELDCNWMGIGGQVFDLNGTPLLNLLVHLEGGGLSLDAYTGSKQEYGPSGYEIALDTTPKETSGEYVVQLLDQGGAPLSAQIVVPTLADCNRNLILVNFVQNH